MPWQCFRFVGPEYLCMNDYYEHMWDNNNDGAEG